LVNVIVTVSDWLTLFPSLAILVLVLSATLLSISYNDARNPRSRRR